MRGKVLSYIELCQREGVSLQRGMNFRLRGRHSVILMSIQENAPYHDQVLDDGATLIYEGHDVPKTAHSPVPKNLDQVAALPSGRLTENGKFQKAALDHKAGRKPPDVVRVYEKIKKGIWSDNGYFHLVDAWQEHDKRRSVFKFRLAAIDDSVSDNVAEDVEALSRPHSRIIPASVKLEVWKRDQGKCVRCSATDELHFDHVLPYSKGGTSLTAENVQLLCARHNLQKSARIE